MKIIFGKKALTLQNPFSLKSFQEVGNTFHPYSRNLSDLYSYINQETNFIDTTTANGQAQAYIKCPPVSTIIRKKAQAFVRGNFFIGNEDGKMRSNPDAVRIWELLNAPNPFQNMNQFIQMAYTMVQLFGKCYIYGQDVSFGTRLPMATAKEWYVVPNTSVTENYNKTAETKFNKPVSYTIKIGGFMYDIPENAMFIWNDDGVDMDLRFMYNSGQSRLYPLGNPVTSNASAYNANNTLLTNYGAIGILSSAGKDVTGSIPLKPEEKTDIQRQFKEKYGILKGQWDMILTEAPLQFSEISKPIRDLMLLETIEDTTRVLAEAYNYPMHLLGFKGGTTFNNVKEARQSLYEEAIIPEAESFCTFLNSEAGIEQSEYRLRVNYDHVGALQQSESDKMESKKQLADLLSQLLTDGVITVDEYKEKINIEEL